MLFQIAFSELIFLKKLWPDINSSDLRKIINKYSNIERKFGI
jgi:undecaprenyl diphosphate synthase